MSLPKTIQASLPFFFIIYFLSSLLLLLLVSFCSSYLGALLEGRFFLAMAILDWLASPTWQSQFQVDSWYFQPNYWVHTSYQPGNATSLNLLYPTKTEPGNYVFRLTFPIQVMNRSCLVASLLVMLDDQLDIKQYQPIATPNCISSKILLLLLSISYIRFHAFTLILSEAL